MVRRSRFDKVMETGALRGKECGSVLFRDVKVEVCRGKRRQDDMLCARETRDSCVAQKPHVYLQIFLFEVVCKRGCVV